MSAGKHEKQGSKSERPDNPYAGIDLDLKDASFDKPELDTEKLNYLVGQLNLLTHSNLEARAKWTLLLQQVESVLQTAGIALRIASVT